MYIQLQLIKALATWQIYKPKTEEMLFISNTESLINLKIEIKSLVPTKKKTDK